MNFSLDGIWQTVLIFALLILLFRLYRLLLPYLLRKESSLKAWQKTAPLLEGLAWALFVVWAVTQFVKDPLIASVGTAVFLLVLLIGFSWFVLRDFMAGTLLRLENAISVGEMLQIGQVKGRVVKTDYFSLELINHKGQAVRIPYRTVWSGIGFKDNPAKNIETHRFTLRLPKQAKKSIDTITQHQRFLLHTSPWTSPAKPSEVAYLGETGQFYQFKIITYAIRATYFQKIENHLLAKNKGAVLTEPV